MRRTKPCCEHESELRRRCALFDIAEAERAFKGERKADSKWPTGWQWLVMAIKVEAKIKHHKERAEQLGYSQAAFLRYFDTNEEFIDEATNAETDTSNKYRLSSDVNQTS